MMRVDAIWLSATPLDMRAGPDTCLARVIEVFGEAKPHHAYLFANKRGNRMKVLVHDGLGVWLLARRLHQGKFTWAKAWQGEQVSLQPAQFDALVSGLPWQQVNRCIRQL